MGSPDEELRKKISIQPPIAACAACGKPYPKRCNTKSCSPECSKELTVRTRKRYAALHVDELRAYHRDYQRAYKARLRGEIGVKIVPCVICKKPFEKRHKTTVCSPECFKERARVYPKKARARHPEKYGNQVHAYQARLRAEVPGEFRQYQRECNRRHKARKAAATGDTTGATLRREIVAANTDTEPTPTGRTDP